MSAPPPKRRKLNGEGESKRNALFHCDYCKKDISNSTRIKCAVCPDFDLCLDCFSVGVELNEKNHKNTHSYRVIDDMSIPLFHLDWGADEELLLLEAIEMNGLGNWSGIEEHVGTKTQAECAEHYWATYIDVPTCPLPDPSRFMPVLEGKADPHPASQGHAAGEAARAQPKPVVGGGKQKKKKAGAGAVYPHIPTTGAEIGYMPLRQDFETEWNNDAEMDLALMEITAEDSPEEEDLKLQLLEAYCRVLDERERRKQFAHEREMVDWKRYQSQRKKRPRDEQALTSQLRPLARFMAAPKFERLVVDLLAEEQIRRKIEYLKTCRAQGIRSLDEAAKYAEVERKRREQESEARRAGAQARRRRPATEDLAALLKARRAAGATVDVSGMQGAEFLTGKEQKLCAALGLAPDQYMAIKDTLVTESARLGYLTRHSAYKLLKLEVDKIDRLYDFFTERQWLVGSKEELEALCKEEEMLKARMLSQQ